MNYSFRMQEFHAASNLSTKVEDSSWKELSLVVMNLAMQASMAQLRDDGNSGFHNDPQEANHMRMPVSHSQSFQKPNFILELPLSMAKLSVEEFLDGYPSS